MSKNLAKLHMFTVQIVFLNPWRLSWVETLVACFQVTNWPLPLTHRQRTLAFSSQGWPGCSESFFLIMPGLHLLSNSETLKHLDQLAWPSRTVHWIDVYFKIFCYASARCYGPFHAVTLHAPRNRLNGWFASWRHRFCPVVKLVCGATWASFWWLNISRLYKNNIRPLFMRDAYTA